MSQLDATPATPAELLEEAGIPFAVFKHPSVVSFADVVEQLGFPPEQLVKTMAFRCADDGIVLAALPARLKVSFGRLAQAVGASRSKLRPADETDLRVLRMEAGGISPVVQAADTRVVFDPSIAELPVVYLGTGRAGETMQVKSADLIEFVRPVLVDIVAA